MIICASMASAETKHEDIDAEPDTIAKELLQIIQRDINCLADGNRAVKKRALEKIKKETLDKGTLTSEVFHIVFREVHKPLLKLFGDQADKCRELSIKLVLGFCHKLNTPWTFLPYIIPTLVQRLGNQEIVEPTEEIRLLHIESLRSLVDICKEHLNLYIEDLIRILERTLVDPFPDVKKASCLCTDRVAITLSEKFYLHGESLIPPLLQSISHQHNKVRVSCLQTIGIVIKATSGKAVDDVVSHLAQRTFDHSPPVRLAVTTVVGDWLLNLRDRYSFFHKLVPLLLTGFSDEMPDIRQKSKDYFDQIGGQYENENEDDFKERKDFHTSKHFEPYLGHQRPHLGCRALVQRNFSKILPALLRDITDWTVETRIKAAHLLYHLVYFAEDHVTMHMEPLLNGLYKSAQDEESQVVQQVVKSAELVGLFVEPSVYCKMILQHIRSVCTNSPNATASALQILAAFVRGANAQLLQQELQEICRTVSGNDVCSTLTHQCHLQLTVFVSAVVNKKEIDRKEVSYELFFILLHVIALTSNEIIVSEAKHQMDVLATVQKLDTIDVLYRIHGLQVLEHLKAGSDSWTSHSSESLLLEALLNFSGPAFFDLIDTTIPILMTNADNKKDPELRLRIFSLISHLVLKPSADKKVTGKLQEYSLTLIQKAILPNCIWQAGRTAAAVRAAAMSCLWALLEGKIMDTKTLRDILPELHTQIVSCLDDHNQTTRLVTCKVLLKLLTACQDAFDADRLNAIYPELLKRMDDNSDEIRVITTRTFSVFFRCFSSYDADLYKLHLQALFKGLLIHLDDPAKDIQEAVSFALKEAAKVSPALLRGQLEEVRHKHRLTKYCDELVEHTELLMRNQLSLEERPSTG